MDEISGAELAKVNSFPVLVSLLRDKLDWPIGDEYGFDDIVYEYEADDLGLKADEIAKIREIHQLRPLVTGQPWGIFFISFEEKGISVTVLRRLLRALVVKKRAGAQTPDRQVWQLNDLIFVANFGRSGEREIAFAHFSDAGGDLPVLNVLGWNTKDTPLHNDYVARSLAEHLRWPDDTEDLTAWRQQWTEAFELRIGEVAQTSQELARQLATLASSIRARANELLAAETDAGSMRQLLAAFRKNLIHELDEDGFADMFAQTISYGLLAAKVSRPGNPLVADNLADMVPKTNPFLKELFASFLSLGGRDKRQGMDFDELGVRDVVNLLNRANMEAVLRDFGNRNPKKDPVIHFYEDFLTAYDKRKKIEAGIFYTPPAVVAFIVRSVDEILRTEFDLPLGLADTTTWGEMAARSSKIKIPKTAKPTDSFVQILDPATGTGTFLVEIVDLIADRMKDHWKDAGCTAREIGALWNNYVEKHLLTRITAFELEMAPYAIAHMKVGLKLNQTGYTFESDARLHILLTNALQPARELDLEERMRMQALAHEAQRANEAKNGTPFTVVVGNPPYSGISKNMFPWIDGLLKGKEPSGGANRKSYYEVDGLPLGEKKVWLQDDYVKFIRLAQYYIDRTGVGLVGYITNHGYLDNPTFRGMRYQLLRTFGRCLFIDLHGSTKKGKTPVGSADENVFDIEQGVAICLLRTSASEKRALLAEDIYGSREEKLSSLGTRSLANSGEMTIYPRTPLYLFRARDESNGPEYDSWPALGTIMGTNVTGIVTARDGVAVAFTRQELMDRVNEFRSDSLPEAAIRQRYWPNKEDGKYQAGDSRGWKLSQAREALKAMEDPAIHITPVDYRPFDRRVVFYDPALVDWGRWDMMPHMTDDESLALSTVRQLAGLPWEHALASSCPQDDCYVSNRTKERGYLYPLWLKPGPGESVWRPNLSVAYATAFGKSLGISYNEVGRGADPGTENLGGSTLFSPRDLFDWIYAILHAPSYRVRYAEFLKSDFPHVPTPGTLGLFRTLARLGHKLVALHLLRPTEASVLAEPTIRFAGRGEALVEQGFPQYENGKVMINGSRWFEDVPRATWEFHIGGYQVCEKWLKDRAGKGGKNPSPGRVLTDDDILHYRRVVVALTETRRVMDEIDAAIEAHGGWPGAFSVGPNEGDGDD